MKRRFHPRLPLSQSHRLLFGSSAKPTRPRLSGHSQPSVLSGRLVDSADHTAHSLHLKKLLGQSPLITAERHIWETSLCNGDTKVLTALICSPHCHEPHNSTLLPSSVEKSTHVSAAKVKIKTRVWLRQVSRGPHKHQHTASVLQLTVAPHKNEK